MINREKNAIEWCNTHKDLLFWIIITILAAWVRYCGRNFISVDMNVFLIDWYYDIKESGGLSGLSQQVGDYNILYQTIIAILSYLDLNCVYMYKMISILFDFCLAASCSFWICKIENAAFFSLKGNILYACILFLPTVILNSSYWGQCDSIYTTFVILTLYALYREKYIPAFIFLGLAFGFKLQAIFILPFMISYYLYKKKFSIGMFGISVLVFWSTGLLAYFNGRSLLAPFQIYIDQSDIYDNMWLDISSIWLLVGDDYESLKTYAIVLALCICGIGLYLILSGKKKLDSPETYLNTAGWFVWTCILFLPAMHDRYAYLLDILLLLLCFLNICYVKYAFISICFSLISYGHFLFGNDGLDTWNAVIFLAAWLHYSYYIISGAYKIKNGNSQNTAS